MNIDEIRSQIIRYNPKLFPDEAKSRRKRRWLGVAVAACLITILLVIMFVLVMLVSPDNERNIMNVAGYAQGALEALGGDSEAVIVSEKYDADAELALPVAGRISSGFGERADPFTGTAEFHKGTDFAADEGTEIFAAADGKVITARFNKYAGNFIEIEHSGGIKTRYLHCSKLLVSEGDAVESGDKIALVGSTGNSTGPHLHFEVQINGAAVNPAELLHD